VRIEPRRRLIPQLLDAQPRHFAGPGPARRERQEEDCEVAASASRSVAPVTISRFKTSRVTARLLLRWRGLAEARTANRSADRRLGAANGPSIPFQRCNVLQLARRPLTVFGACGPSQRSKPSARKLSATSAGIPCRGSLERLAGSQR
jgi:hypothetical protein